MRRVLLTGADGYIGRPVFEHLIARGFEVHATSRQDQQAVVPSVWHKVDLLDVDAHDRLLASIKATHLIHLAWETSPGDYWQSDDNARWEAASINLLKTFHSHGGTRAILAGSCAEYDWRAGHCVEGETPTRGISPYTSAKLSFRAAANALADSTNLDVAWSRIFYSFGPNEHPDRLVASVIKALIAGARAPCSDGLQVRDFMFVDDLAEAFVAVLESDFCGDINIASGKGMSIRVLISRIADDLGALDRVDFGARPRQPNDPSHITADVSKLRDAVGWSSDRDIESAIGETITWWKKQGIRT